MITVHITCSACYPPKSEPIVIEGALPKQLEKNRLARIIRQHGWIVQFNGDVMDTYCCKECAL